MSNNSKELVGTGIGNQLIRRTARSTKPRAFCALVISVRTTVPVYPEGQQLFFRRIKLSDSSSCSCPTSSSHPCRVLASRPPISTETSRLGILAFPGRSSLSFLTYTTRLGGSWRITQGCDLFKGPSPSPLRSLLVTRPGSASIPTDLWALS